MKFAAFLAVFCFAQSALAETKTYATCKVTADNPESILEGTGMNPRKARIGYNPKTRAHFFELTGYVMYPHAFVKGTFSVKLSRLYNTAEELSGEESTGDTHFRLKADPSNSKRLTGYGAMKQDYGIQLDCIRI